MGRLTELAVTWRQQAGMLRRYGDERGATVLEAIAAQLEEALPEHESEVVTLSQAAAEGGYSERRLRERVAEGKLENRGGKGRPRIIRRDLWLQRRSQRGDRLTSKRFRAYLKAHPLPPSRICSRGSAGPERRTLGRSPLSGRTNPNSHLLTRTDPCPSTTWPDAGGILGGISCGW